MITTLTRWRRRFVQINYYYPNPVDRQRARLLLYFLWVLFFIGLITTALVVVPVFLRQRFLNLPGASVVLLTMIIPILMAAIQRGYLWLASWALVLFLLAASAIPSFNGIEDIRSIIIMLPLVIAGMLLNWQGMLTTLLIALGIVLAGWANSFALPDVTNSNALLIDGLALVITVVVSGLFLLIFNTRLTLLPPRFTEELQQLRLFAGLNLFASETDTEATLSNRVVDMLCDAGEYPFARVFLLDASGSQIEHIFLGSGLLVVGQLTDPQTDSAVREVLFTRQMTLVDSSQAAIRREHLLPGSVAGLLLPLLHKGELIGILDVQTLRATGFSTGEQTSLALLAQNLSNAVSQLRHIAFQTHTLQEQQATIQRQRDRLQQLERADQQAVINAWSAYLEQRGQHVFGYDVDESLLAPRPASDLPLSLQHTLAHGDIVVEQADGQQLIGVPIALRGQVVGGISFALPSNRPVTQRQKEMIASVIQRLALALDNKRLFEQSQAQAQRESKANDIARLLLTSTDVETVLQLAASTFNETLGAVQTRIHLNPAIQAPAEDAS
jgi:GAF domain-containing protein